MGCYSNSPVSSHRTLLIGWLFRIEFILRFVHVLEIFRPLAGELGWRKFLVGIFTHSVSLGITWYGRRV